MIEFLSWVASILAVTWARKGDVGKVIDQQASRDEYIDKLKLRQQRFAGYLGQFNDLLDHLLGNWYRTFFFCVMLALIYSSVMFLFNLAFAKGMLGMENFDLWKAKLLFAGLMLTTFVTYGTARFNNDASRFFKGTTEPVGAGHHRLIRRRHLIGHLVFAVYYAAAIWLVYHNVTLTVFSLVVAATAAIMSTTELNVQQQFDQFGLHLAVGAALGGHGLLVAILFFAAGDASWHIYALIVGATLLCGVLTLIAVQNSICVNHDINQKPGCRFRSEIGRAPLFVGIYCSRAPGSFCCAVGTLLLACYFAKQVGAPQEITVPASVILTSAIFLAGATTIAGAGVFALAIMLLVTGLIILSGRDDLLFKEWPYLVVFWFVFPLLNAIFDFVRWQIVRLGIRYRLAKTEANSLVLIVLDLATAVIAISAFTFVSVWLIDQYNGKILEHGGKAIPISGYIEKIHGDFWNFGVWILLMVSTMLIPTICNLVIFLAAGSIKAVPARLRLRLVDELNNYMALSELRKDWLTWRLAAVDSFAGIIYFVAMMALTAYLVILIAPSFGEFLYVLAKAALRPTLSLSAVFPNS